MNPWDVAQMVLADPDPSQIIYAIRMERDDDRTCELCRWMNGKIIDIRHPDYFQYTSPHVNCRGTWGYITGDTKEFFHDPDWGEPPLSLVAKFADGLLKAGARESLGIRDVPEVISYEEFRGAVDVPEVREAGPEAAVRSADLNWFMDPDMSGAVRKKILDAFDALPDEVRRLFDPNFPRGVTAVDAPGDTVSGGFVMIGSDSLGSAGRIQNALLSALVDGELSDLVVPAGLDASVVVRALRSFDAADPGGWLAGHGLPEGLGARMGVVAPAPLKWDQFRDSVGLYVRYPEATGRAEGPVNGPVLPEVPDALPFADLDDDAFRRNAGASVLVRTGGDQVEGMNAVVTRFEAHGGEVGHIVELKLTAGAADALAAHLDSLGGQRSTFSYREGRVADGRLVHADRTRDFGESMTYRTRNAEIEVIGAVGSPYEVNAALAGKVRVTLRTGGDPAQVRVLLDGLAGDLGYDPFRRVLEAPGAEDIEAYKRNRLAWQHRRDPDDVRQEQIDGLELREVYPGYSTYVDPGASARYEEMGVRGLFTVTGVDPLVGMLHRDGAISSAERYRQGYLIEGKSTAEDFRQGGADHVFCRVLTDGARGRRITETMGGPLGISGNCLIRWKLDVLDRTDWYAYDSDQFGTTQGEVFEDRPSPEAFIRHQVDNWYDGNEVMFRVGLAKEAVDYVSVTDNATRDRFIESLLAKGVISSLDDTINGKALDDFIRVEEEY